MAEKIILQIAMKAVIVHKGKVLILREAATYDDGTQRGRYHLPGGRIEPGEHFNDALRREVREETGLEVEIGQPIYVGEWRPVIKGKTHQIVAVFIVCQADTDKITLSSEHDDYQWIYPKERHTFDLMNPEPEVIDRYTEHLN